MTEREKMADDFEEKLEAEVTARLEQMEDPSYEFSPRMKKADWIAAGILMVIALVVTEYFTLTAGVM